MSQDDKKSKPEPDAEEVELTEEQREAAKKKFEKKCQAKKVVTPQTKFFRGKWAMKSNPNELETVRISVEGEVLQWQRGVMTIVPDPYLQAARDATVQQFTQNPGQGRKLVAIISRFNFEIDTAKPEASFQDFKDMYKTGTEKTKQAVGQFGLNIPVDQAIPQVQY